VFGVRGEVNILMINILITPQHSQIDPEC
jgi:hypothetical protein